MLITINLAAPQSSSSWFVEHALYSLYFQAPFFLYINSTLLECHNVRPVNYLKDCDCQEGYYRPLYMDSVITVRKQGQKRLDRAQMASVSRDSNWIWTGGPGSITKYLGHTILDGTHAQTEVEIEINDGVSHVLTNKHHLVCLKR